ncbi:hypothetical protein [Rheinheimera sp. 4Y26]|uniref:hypothetical protein n=1 Tax=Rheinheimera sp. 4Y26 TaxID=2977811 RepID=UPI0021B119FD|nr:hypothetical protein [Rheinheimera sp. 4Y26]MCT6701044.1 hypothetical protein [Rheinheimera sp. 4Y26]
MKLTQSRCLLATSLLLASFASQAGNQSYQMVLMTENTAEAKAPAATTDPYVRQTRLCVAYSKQGQSAQAKRACHQAVMLVRQAGEGPVGMQRQLRSYAYSNRGVAKVLSGDNIGALADFQRAHRINANAVSQHNLGKLTSSLNTGTALLAANPLESDTD